jgi:hypothetical protein
MYGDIIKKPYVGKGSSYSNNRDCFMILYINENATEDKYSVVSMIDGLLEERIF